MYHHSDNIVASAARAVDSRVFDAIEALMPQPLQSLGSASAYSAALTCTAGTIQFARVICNDAERVVIEFSDNETQRTGRPHLRDTPRTFRVQCELANRRATLLLPWQNQTHAWSFRAATQTSGKRRMDRELGQCLHALQGAQQIHGTLQLHTKDTA